MAIQGDELEKSDSKVMIKMEVAKFQRPHTVSTISRINFNSMILEQKELQSRLPVQTPTDTVNLKELLVTKQSTTKIERPMTSKIQMKPTLKSNTQALRIKSANVNLARQS